MDKLNEIEKYLDHTTELQFEINNGEVDLHVCFNHDKKEEFLLADVYLKFVEFLKEGETTLLIKENTNDVNRDRFYRTSLVKKDSADTVHLNHVLWSEQTLQNFLDTVTDQSKIRLNVVWPDTGKQEFVSHPEASKHEALFIDGYVFKKHTIPGDDNNG